MKSRFTFLLLVVFLVGLPLSLHATEVYQWTDENGVVHFSQWAPETDQQDLAVVEVDGGEGAENGLGISEEDDPEGYRINRESMDALWAERKARREAERERQERAARTEFVYLRPETEYAYQYPFFLPGYGNRPPHRPGRPPKPTPLPIPDPLPPTATWKRP